MRFILEEQKREEFVFGLGEPSVIHRRKPFKKKKKKISLTLKPRAKRRIWTAF